MAAIDVVNRVLREFRRYTGDGLPGEPVNAPLPVGDPQSGVHSPKKAELRAALLAPLEDAGQSANAAEAAAARAEAARDDIDEKWLGAHPDDASATAAAGGSPIVGAEYWNTTIGKRKTWDGTVWQENDVALNDGAVTEPKLADEAVSTRALAAEAVTIEKVAAAVMARMDASRPSQGRARVDYWTTSAIAAFVPAALAMNGFRMFGNNYKYGQPVFSTGGAGRKVVSIIDNVAYENIATKLNWYALFAVANEGDATCSFVLAPFLRVYSVAGNVVTLGGGAANQNASPVTKTYDMNNDVLAGTDCLIINQGANWSGRVTTVTANTDSTVTLGDATGLTQLNFLLPAPPGWDHYVYLCGSIYHEVGSSAIGGDFRNIADSGSKVLSRMVNAGEYPTGGTVSPVKVRLGGEIPPLAAGVICSPGGTLSTTSSGSVVVQLWHDGNNHDVFRLIGAKEGAANFPFNQMAEVTFSKEQAFHVLFGGTLASQIAGGTCLIYGWIEP